MRCLTHLCHLFTFVKSNCFKPFSDVKAEITILLAEFWVGLQKCLCCPLCFSSDAFESFYNLDQVVSVFLETWLPSSNADKTLNPLINVRPYVPSLLQDLVDRVVASSRSINIFPQLPYRYWIEET